MDSDRRKEWIVGAAAPVALLIVLAILAQTSEQPVAWIAFMGAIPLISAMYARPAVTAVIALMAVLTAGVSSAQVYGTKFPDSLPILFGVIVLSGAAVLVCQTRNAPKPRAATEVRPATTPGRSELAHVDSMTGLPTREGALAIIDDLNARGPQVVGVIDCDHLAAINDAHGTAIGDTFVFAVAGRTRYALPNTDLVARWDGEEFVVVISGTLDDVRPTLEHIAAKVNDNKIRTDAGLIPATISIGASTWHVGENFNDSFERARQALYRAKLNGGAQLVADE